MKKILVLLGPNLNLTGQRDVDVYGQEREKQIEAQIVQKSNKLSLDCQIFQSNWEGALIDKIHASIGKIDGIIINAGALSHYSIALRDAIACMNVPCIEVHMSNIYAREDFRQKSVLTDVCVGQICGFGKNSYLLAIDAIFDLI